MLHVGGSKLKVVKAHKYCVQISVQSCIHTLNKRATYVQYLAEKI